jgi:hypothetical protein
MQFLQPIASLLGVTVGQMVIVAIAIVVLVIAWYALKVALKIAMRIFAIGCFSIVVVAAALYLFFAFFAH